MNVFVHLGDVEVDEISEGVKNTTHAAGTFATWAVFDGVAYITRQLEGLVGRGRASGAVGNALLTVELDEGCVVVVPKGGNGLALACFGCGRFEVVAVCCILDGGVGVGCGCFGSWCRC